MLQFCPEMTYYDTLGVPKTATHQEIKVFFIKTSMFIPFYLESLP